MIEATHVRDYIKRLAPIAVLSLLASSVFAQNASNRLENISAMALPGNKVELTLELAGPAPEPLAFTIDQPARIALDLADTALGLDSRRTDISIGVLDTVLAAEAGGRTRVVLNLDDLVGYQTRVAGNTVVVTLESPASTNTKVTQFAAAPASSAAAAESSEGRSIESIDFRRGDNGGGRVIISLSDAGIPVDVRQEGGQVVVNFEDTLLPGSLLKRYDVLDFATPVSSIDALRVNDDARLVIAANGNYEELAYQSDKIFTVEIQPVVTEEGPASATIYSGDKEYSGERLTLNFQDIDTRAVLQLLADISGRNIVVSDTVEGNVTLRLQNVPWDQAMDIVLATKGLDMRENGNVIIVAPADEIAAREKADLESRKEIKELEPLFSEFVQINYAKAGDLANLIGESSDGALLSDRGSVAIDERTNTLLVKDTAGNLAEIRRLVATLDVPVRQVLIESRIVVVNDDFSRDIGVRWGFTGVDDNGDNGLVAISGTGAGTDSIVQSGIENLQDTGSVFPVDLPNQGDRYNVRLPVTNPAGTFALAVLDDDYLIDLEISAAQAEGNTEVISSPRVITANQKEAKIVQGVEIPYQESSSSGATTTQFKEALLSLTVTPQITPDDRIIMDLIVSKDSIGEVVVTENGAQPSIDTREVITQVLVDNGQTVVLGGIYETDTGDFQTKVPFLGDIPVVGNLFKSTRRVSNKSELLVFVTPKILKEGSTIY
ncbi:MAG: type IV pilus secretin PilQ [Gammaproteobacteria bacterium]|nr:type IV pilus secretin PilQ [Gammaproteobacteria bacterium]